MQFKEESKVANRDWVDHQACSLLQYINVIANLFYTVHKIGDIGTQKNLEIKILICRINTFVFGYSIMSAFSSII